MAGSPIRLARRRAVRDVDIVSEPSNVNHSHLRFVSTVPGLTITVGPMVNDEAVKVMADIMTSLQTS